MRVVVTGSSGFIGSHLCERLLADGHELTGLDLREPQGDAALDLEFHRLDLRTARLTGVLRGADAVVHLAGLPGVRGPAGAGYLEHNVLGTRALLEALGRRGARDARLVVASSSSVYAPSEGPTREDAALAPASVYGATKLAVERECAARRGLDHVVLRLFTVYGPRQRSDMAFARFLVAALGGEPAPLFGDGGQVRDFTYVQDAVEGILLAIARGTRGRVYNIAGGEPAALTDALSLLSDLVGREIPLTPGGPPAAEARRTHADLARSRDELGYRPSVALADGISAQILAARACRAVAA